MESRIDYLKRQITKALRNAKGADVMGYYGAASFYEDKARMLYKELKALEENANER